MSAASRSVPLGARLELAGVTVRLGGQLALEDVDLRVGPGELVGLIGPNGAGKTTLLRAVLGLVAFDGTITLDGAPLRVRHRGVGYVPQRHEFAWDFPISVRGAVLTGRTRAIGWLRRVSRTDRDLVDEALGRVGLLDLAERPIGELSGGQRQRVLVARALAVRSDLLLFDEPFTGVDVPTQEVLGALLADLRAEGHTMVLTTHDLAAAAASCSRLVLLDRSVVADDHPSALVDPEPWLQAFRVPSSDQLLATLTASPPGAPQGASPPAGAVS